MLSIFAYSNDFSRNITKGGKTITVNDVISNPAYTRVIVNKEAGKVNTIFDYMIFFKTTNKTFSYNNQSDFTIGLKEFIHAKIYSNLDLKVTQSPAHLSCNIESLRLICKVLDNYAGNDTLVLELYDKSFKLKSAMKFEFKLTNNYVLPTFNVNEKTIEFNEDEVLNFDLTGIVNNPDALAYTISISSLPSYNNCSINNYTLNCNPVQDYFGGDSLELKINESGSTANILLEILPVNDLPILDNSKLTNGSVEVNINDGIHTIITLEDYVIDPDYPRSYSYQIVDTTNIASCFISESSLDCVGLKTGTANINVLLTDDKLSLTIPVHLVVYKNNAPVLDNSKLTNGKILLDITDKLPVSVNLKNYVIDIDDVKNYTYEFVSNPTIANCSVNADVLSCTKIKDGLENFTIKLSDDNFTLLLPIEVQVITPIVPPQYLNNFIDKGITIFEANPNFIINLEGIFLDPNEEGSGPNPETDTLQYGFDKVSGNANVVCNSGYKKLNCTASGATSYADITLWAQRGTKKTYIPNVYRVAVVKQSDFSSAIFGPQKVINAQAFDMDLSVKSNLGFDIYKLPISVYSVPPVETHFYYPDGSIDGQYWYIDLKSNEVQTKKVQVTTPNASEPKDYELAPKLDGVTSTFTPTIVTSIPYTAQYLKDYLSVVGYTPGHRDDGKDNYLPLGIKTVIPFKISNYLDVPVNVFVCKDPTIGDASQVVLYDSENTNLEIIAQYSCVSKKLSPGLTEDTIVAKVNDIYKLYTPVLFLDLQKPILSDASFASYWTYKNASNTFILDNPEMQFYFDNLSLLGANVLSPSDGSTLTKNTQYNLNVRYSNSYAYSLVDVPGCFNLIYGLIGSGVYSTDNDFASTIGSNCTNINLGYHSSTSTDNKKTMPFQFKTKSLGANLDNPPFFAIAGGFNTPSGFLDVFDAWYIIN